MKIGDLVRYLNLEPGGLGMERWKGEPYFEKAHRGD